MAKRKHYKRSKSGNMGSIWGNVLGVGGYILYEAALKPKIPLAATTLNIAELAAGVMLSKKSGIIGNIAKTAVVLNTYQLIKPVIAGQLGSMLSTSPIYS